MWYYTDRLYYIEHLLKKYTLFALTEYKFARLGFWFIADVLKDDHVQRVIHPPTSCAYKNTWIRFVIKVHVLLLYDD